MIERMTDPDSIREMLNHYRFAPLQLIGDRHSMVGRLFSPECRHKQAVIEALGGDFNDVREVVSDHGIEGLFDYFDNNLIALASFRELERVYDHRDHGYYTPLPNITALDLGIPEHVVQMAIDSNHVLNDCVTCRVSLADFINVTYPLHFMHMSQFNSNKIAFTESESMLVQDRQTRTRFGRYLTRFFSEWLTAPEIAEIANRFNQKFASYKLEFATTGDDIEWVYNNGPCSCMSYPAGHFRSSEHPVRAYESPDISIAYTHNGGEIVARTVCNEIHKTYTRIYGNESLLFTLLENAGYEEGDLSGCRLKRIVDDGDKFVGPYIDSPGHSTAISDEGDWLRIGRSDGVVIGDAERSHDTGGYLTEVNLVTCEDCGSTVSEEDTTLVERMGQVCSNCIESGDYVEPQDAICLYHIDDCVQTETDEFYTSVAAAIDDGYVVTVDTDKVCDPDDVYETTDDTYYEHKSNASRAGYVSTEDNDDVLCPREECYLTDNGDYYFALENATLDGYKLNDDDLLELESETAA